MNRNNLIIIFLFSLVAITIIDTTLNICLTKTVSPLLSSTFEVVKSLIYLIILGSTEVAMDISKSLFTKKISKNYNSLHYYIQRIRSKMEKYTTFINIKN